MDKCKQCNGDLPHTERQVGGVHMGCEYDYFFNDNIPMIKIRPANSQSSWCVLEPKEAESVMSDSEEPYEFQNILMSKGKIEALKEHGGW